MLPNNYRLLAQSSIGFRAAIFIPFMATEVQGTQKNAVKLIFIAAAVIIGLWFGYIIMPILFFLFFAIVLTLVLNAPVMWLTKKVGTVPWRPSRCF